MERVLIRHLTGSKANEIVTFPAESFKEIIIGRDSAADVKYDPNRDDIVSRQHAKIAHDPINPSRFILTDLNSRNGTLVNGQKIINATTIKPGDIVRLGQDGPEFLFEIDPKQDSSPSTKFSPAHRENNDAPKTREGTVRPTSDSNHSPGRMTKLEQQLEGNSKRTKKLLINGAAFGMALIGLVAFVMWRKTEIIIDNKPLTPTQIADKNSNAVVFIEVAWKVIYTETGKQLFQRTLPICEQYDKKGNCVGRPKPIPTYLDTGQNAIEPWLTVEEVSSDGSKNLPIGGQHTGSGFVVKSDGFILTNRHVAASWQTKGDTPPGVLCDRDIAVSNSRCKPIRLLAAQEANQINWVPSNPKLFGTLSGKAVEGRIDYMYVTFPKTKLRIPARLVRTSDTADVALIKVDVPQALPAVELDQNTQVQSGDSITVMGYPGIASDTFVRIESQDPFNKQAAWTTIPEPTVTPGNIGKVQRGEASNGVIRDFGDTYQLTVNATGSGNSGGPVFNERGGAIGLFTYGRHMGGTSISFAVPIKYGMDIMGIQQVVQ